MSDGQMTDPTFIGQQEPSFFEKLGMNKFLSLLFLAVLILSVPLTLVILQKRQQTRQNASSSTEFGMAIDIRDPLKVPDSSITSGLNPSWFRFVYPCVNSIINNNSCPNDWHSVNQLASVPSGVKKLAVITGDTTWNAPIGSTDFNTWKNYSDNVFVPTVRAIVDQQGSHFSAVELWNEEDLNAGPSYDPSIPPDAYAYMVASASSAIKSLNQNIKVVTGGLAGGNFPQYILSMKQANPNVFQNVDAIAIHPYQSPENVSTIASLYSGLRTALDQNGITQQIWVTEIGIQNFTHTDSPKNQSEFLQTVFGQLQALQTPVVIWYSYIDYMTGGDGSSGWGLVDGNKVVKQSGTAFTNFTILPTPTPSSSSNNTKIYIDLDQKGGATVITTGSEACSAYIFDPPTTGGGLLNCQHAGGFTCNTTDPNAKNPENDGNNCWWKWTCTQGPSGTYNLKFGVDPLKNPTGDACSSQKQYTISQSGANLCPNPLIFGGTNGPFTSEPIPKIIKDITLTPSYRNIVISWKTLQPNQNSSYDFTSYDQQLQSATAQGQTPVIIFCEGDCFPDWIRNQNSEVSNCCSSSYVCRKIQDSDNATQSFVNMVTATANHFKGKVSLWDYGLEPNCRGYDAVTFTELLKKFSTAVRGADPQNKIIAGHFSGAPSDYVTQVYNDNGKDYFDKIAIDPYGQNGAFLDTTGIEELHNLMVSKGDGGKPIWISEWGLQTKGNETNQANLITAGLNYMATKPWIEAAFYLNYECDIGNEGCHPGDPHYLGYGLYKYGTGPNDISPKEAYTAFKSAENACVNSTPTPSPAPAGTCSPSNSNSCPTGSSCQLVPSVCPTQAPCPPGALCPLFVCDRLYTCVPNATPTPTPASLTPTPTATPSPTKSITPTPTPTPTLIPTLTPIPTPTFVPNSVRLSFSLTLQGLGTGIQNGVPIIPIHQQQTLTVQLYNIQNTLVRTAEGLLTINPDTKKFEGTVDLGPGLLNATYFLKIKVGKYLQKSVNSPLVIVSSSVSTTIPVTATVNLFPGDLNGDNVINILDFNILLSCYNKSQPSPSCPNPSVADLNDDGKVDALDYNILFNGIRAQTGQ